MIESYVAKIRFASLKQPLPRNSDGGELPDEDVMRVSLTGIPDRLPYPLRRVFV